MAQGFETAKSGAFAALLAGVMTPEGPRLTLWTPVFTRLPAPLYGAGSTTPGDLRLWTLGGALVSVQALFVQPEGGAGPRVDTVYLSWCDRQKERRRICTMCPHTRESLAPIVALARAGWGIVLVQGTGPQVGDDLARNVVAAEQVEPLPLGVLVAATAGWMGYMIQQSLQNALARAAVDRAVVTLITQTECAANDPNLRNPTKPIGHPLTPV